MPSHSVRRHLAFDPGHLFDLVADVERYPEFVPWWIASTITHREGDIYFTSQTVGMALMRHEFKSKTELMRPNMIRISSDEKPFRNLNMHWTFDGADQGGCNVSLDVNFELSSVRFGFMASIISSEGVRRLVTAFEDRARIIGPATPAPSQETEADQATPGAHLGAHHAEHHAPPRRVVHRSVMHHEQETQSVSV